MRFIIVCKVSPSVNTRRGRQSFCDGARWRVAHGTFRSRYRTHALRQPLAHGLFVAMLALWWLRLGADAGHPSGPLLKIFTIALAPLALAFHFFRSRGLKGGAVATAAMLGLLVLFCLSGELGIYAVRLMRH